MYDTYTIGVKLSIFLCDPVFEVMKNNFSFGFYSTCTFVFWLPNLGKLDSFHALLTKNGKLMTQYCPCVDMQE